MPYVNASDGAQIFYRATGSGPPLILCTASFSTHLHWAGQEADLGSDHRLVTWDYRGHGRSEAPPAERFSLGQIVDDLRAVHEAACGDEPAVVGGLSIGGLISMSYYLAHPERVRAVMLFNTGPGFKKPEALAQWQEMLEKAASKMEAVGMESYLEGRRAQAQLLGLDPESAAARAVRPGILASTIPGLVAFARRVAGPVPNLVDRLHEIQIPTLVLVGSEDRAFQRAGEVMAAKLPDARHQTLPDAGHVLNLDQPEAFSAAVRGFLASL